jgi:phage shock protein A
MDPDGGKLLDTQREQGRGQRQTCVGEDELLRAESGVSMNVGGQRSVALEFRRRAETEQYRKEAEKVRATAKQAMSAGDRAFWLAQAANWEKLAKEAAAPKVKPWAT